MFVSVWRSLIAVVVLMPMVAAPAFAARPDVRKMSCAQAQSTVQRYGAIVMTTGRHTYERFVSHRRFCDNWEAIAPAVAPTRDNKRCVVAFRCEMPLFNRW